MSRASSGSFPVVVIGGSAGALGPLSLIAGDLPPGFCGCVLVVLHVGAPSYLPQILQRAGVLPVEHAADGHLLQPGKIFVAPPGVHLVIDKGRMQLANGPRQNGSRPAIDPLFLSAARDYGKRVIGVILSGALDDGSAGMAAIKNARGTTIVQDPADASSPEMPRNAMAATNVDYILRGDKIGVKLNELAATPRRADGKSQPQRVAKISERHMMVESSESDPTADPAGKITTMTCPECGGTLWELREGKILRFKCHVGHSYSPQSMIAAQSNSVEEALWVAMRSLKEKSRLFTKLARDARDQARRHSEKHYAKAAEEFEKRAELLRRGLLDLPHTSGDAASNPQTGS